MPVLKNDSPALDSVLAGVREALGSSAVVELDVPSTGSEDFAWYGQHVPIVQLRIGSRAAGKSVQLHQSDYVCNEGAIPAGAMAMASGAARLARQA